jgi:cytochrome P450
MTPLSNNILNQNNSLESKKVTIQESTGATQWAKSWFNYGIAYFQEAKEFCCGHYTYNALLNIKVAKKITPFTSERVVTCSQLDTKNTRFGIPTLKQAHILSHHADIEAVLKSQRGGEFFDSGFETQLSYFIGNTNMLLCKADDHLRLRKPLEKLFSNRFIREDLSKEVINIGMQSLNETKTDKNYTIQRFVLNVFLQVMMGITLSDDELNSLTFHLNPHGNNRETLRAFFKPFLENKDCIPGRAADILKNDPTLSETEKLDTIVMLLAAGTHTTHSFIEFFLQMLIGNPSAKENILEEWSKATEGKTFVTAEEFIPTFQQFVNDSKWLKACFLACERLFPIIADIKRIAKKNIQIEDVQINAGDEVHLNLLPSQYYEEEIKSERLKFDPEAFLNGKSNTLTFAQVSSRKCLGMFLAEIEAKTFIGLITILYKSGKQIDPNVFSFTNLMIYEQFSLRPSYTFDFYELEPRTEEAKKIIDSAKTQTA